MVSRFADARVVGTCSKAVSVETAADSQGRIRTTQGVASAAGVAALLAAVVLAVVAIPVGVALAGLMVGCVTMLAVKAVALGTAVQRIAVAYFGGEVVPAVVARGGSKRVSTIIR